MKPGVAKAPRRRAHEERLDQFESDLRSALARLREVQGHSTSDNEQIGASRFFIERTLESVTAIRGMR